MNYYRLDLVGIKANAQKDGELPKFARLMLGSSISGWQVEADMDWSVLKELALMLRKVIKEYEAETAMPVQINPKSYTTIGVHPEDW